MCYKHTHTKYSTFNFILLFLYILHKCPQYSKNCVESSWATVTDNILETYFKINRKIKINKRIFKSLFHRTQDENRNKRRLNHIQIYVRCSMYFSKDNRFKEPKTVGACLCQNEPMCVFVVVRKYEQNSLFFNFTVTCTQIYCLSLV